MFLDDENESANLSAEGTPITEATFKRQGWEKYIETDDDERIVYWTLPLPKDNPDGNMFCLMSSIDIDWEEMGIPKGCYVVELHNYGALGYCSTEEEIEILYKALTGEDIYENK